jgi:hypothetical protein
MPRHERRITKPCRTRGRYHYTRGVTTMPWPIWPSTHVRALPRPSANPALDQLIVPASWRAMRIRPGDRRFDRCRAKRQLIATPFEIRAQHEANPAPRRFPRPSPSETAASRLDLVRPIGQREVASSVACRFLAQQSRDGVGHRGRWCSPRETNLLAPLDDVLPPQLAVASERSSDEPRLCWWNERPTNTGPDIGSRSRSVWPARS